MIARKKEYYEGFYHGRLIRLERQFREHRFTDDECQALCDGEWISIFNLKNGDTLYGVYGCLEKDDRPRLSSDMSSKPVYVFKVKEPRFNEPDYCFENRERHYGPDDTFSDVSYDDEEESEHMMDYHADLRTIERDIDNALNAVDEEDEKIINVLNYNDLPLLYDGTHIPVFIPVVDGMAVTSDGNVVLDDDTVAQIRKTPEKGLDILHKKWTAWQNDIQFEFIEYDEDELSRSLGWNTEYAIDDRVSQDDDFIDEDSDEMVGEDIYRDDEEFLMSSDDYDTAVLEGFVRKPDEDANLL